MLLVGTNGSPSDFARIGMMLALFPRADARIRFGDSKSWRGTDNGGPTEVAPGGAALRSMEDRPAVTVHRCETCKKVTAGEG